jgi:methyl-accepting chemotaxis protein
MKIKVILPVTISLLVSLQLAANGYNAYEAMQQRSEAVAFVKVDDTAGLLLTSAGEWAIERGLSNAGLHNKSPATEAARADIAKHRATADEALHQALAQMREIPAMRDGNRAIDDAEKAFATVKQLRSRVDEALTKDGDARAGNVANDFAPAITNLIAETAELRLVLETMTRPPAAQLVQIGNLRHFAAEMAEYAGRERARLVVIVGARQPLSEDDYRVLSEGRGHIDVAWRAISVLRARPDAPKSLVAAINAVEKTYLGDYAKLRDGIIASGSTGNYPIDGKQYFERATAAINTILQLTQQMGEVAQTAAAEKASTSTMVMIVSGLLLAAGLVLTGVSFWITHARIVKPFGAMTNAMTRLSSGDVTVEIPARDNTDEIGEMAKAVQVFKDNMVETEHLRAEQEELKQRAEEQQRQAMLAMADNFEAAVGGIVKSVSSQATELQAAAQSMSATAEETERQTTVVAAASEQASTNVQTVASAAEELASSIAEISRQVATSSDITARAVEDTRRTNEQIQGLAEAAQSIGDVVKLISDIASQTNLLALNATIEAARAGDAGKGFAVVASEVKSLASQTAKATEEISTKITEMQTATSHSVTAVQEIGQTIARINEIATTIASAVEEQGAATQEIARNVQQASAGTTEVSMNIVGVTRAANDTGAASNQVFSSASELSQNSEALRSQVDEFLHKIRAA